VALSDAARCWVRMAERPCELAVARRVADAMEGVLSRSSIFSWRANRLETDGSSDEETVGRFWSRGQWDSAGSRVACGAAAGGWSEPTVRCRAATQNVRGRVVFGEGSSSAHMKRRRAGGQHPGR
jgi:hypothetical protein